MCPPSHPFLFVTLSLVTFYSPSQSLSVSLIHTKYYLISLICILLSFYSTHSHPPLSLSLFLYLREFCIYVQCARMTEDTPRIEECIRLFNGITTWVVCNILREYTILKRADIVEKFIDTTKVYDTILVVFYSSSFSIFFFSSFSFLQYLHELHGYNAMLAVVGGLNHFSVKRLQQTWSKVDKNKKDVRSGRGEREAIIHYYPLH